MFKWKVDVIDALKLYGYTTVKKQEDFLNGPTMVKIRHDEMISMNQLGKLCELFNCDIGDLITYVPDDEDVKKSKIKV